MNSEYVLTTDERDRQLNILAGQLDPDDGCSRQASRTLARLKLEASDDALRDLVQGAPSRTGGPQPIGRRHAGEHEAAGDDEDDEESEGGA